MCVQGQKPVIRLYTVTTSKTNNLFIHCYSLKTQPSVQTLTASKPSVYTLLQRQKPTICLYTVTASKTICLYTITTSKTNHLSMNYYNVKNHPSVYTLLQRQKPTICLNYYNVKNQPSVYTLLQCQKPTICLWTVTMSKTTQPFIHQRTITHVLLPNYILQALATGSWLSRTWLWALWPMLFCRMRTGAVRTP